MSNAAENFDTEDQFEMDGQDFDNEGFEDDGDDGDDGADVVIPELVEPVKRKAGRPKGTTKKRKQGEIDLEEIQDPFVFAEQYIIQMNEPIKMLIKRAGSLIAVLDYASDPSKFAVKSLSDVQSSLGAGMYSFQIVSLINHKIVREFRESISSQPEIFTSKIKNEQVSPSPGDDRFEKAISAMAALKETSNNSPQVQASLPQQTQPDSLVDTLVRLVPLITILKETGFIGQQKQQKTEAEIKMEMWIQQQENEKRLRAEIRKEFEELEVKAEKKAQELYEKMGGEPKEKSLLEEGLDIFKNVAEVMKVQTAAKAAVTRRALPQRPKVQELPQPQTVQPSTPEVVETVPVKKNPLEATILHIIQKATSLGSEEKVVEYVNTQPKIRELLKKYDCDTVCKETHKLLGLTEESQQLNDLVNKIYANLQ